MSLPSAHLDAFEAVAKTSSFSKAAKLLNLTQSGLSQKIKAFEKELGLSLFIRTPTGVLMTDQAEKLLRYCQAKNSMETELLNSLSSEDTERISGVLKIATYSSVFRSVILPALTPLLKENTNIKIEFVCDEMHLLPKKLQSSEVDFIIMDCDLDKKNIEKAYLGKEEYVMIHSLKNNKKPLVLLDNDLNDDATANFFKSQKLKKLPKHTRSYFNDCYGIIDGVKENLGSAVMSKHLIKNNKHIKIDDTYKPLSLNVMLYYHRQPYYSKLHKSIVQCLKENCQKYL